MRKSVLAVATGAALVLPGMASALQAAEAAAEVAAPVGPRENEALPIGGYLQQPSGALMRVDRDWTSAEGMPLYVMNRECRGHCAQLFPPLTPDVGDTPPSADWTIRIRDENGDAQWVYKGQPVYVFHEDEPDAHPMAHDVYPGIVLAQP